MRAVDRRSSTRLPHCSTEVVIIGNGPAGLALSAFLTGWHPYYTGVHPDPAIHFRLHQHSDKSLLDQDLSWFSEECAERYNPSVGPLNALYDTLVRPAADGINGGEITANSNANGESCLEWRFYPERAVPHLVLGDEGIGGSWCAYDPQMLTVSQAEWMSLPGYPITDYMGVGSDGSARVTADTVRRYLVEYAKKMGLGDGEETSIYPWHSVDAIEKKRCCHNNEESWLVKSNPLPFRRHFSSKRLVLAAGKSKPRRLNVDGEDNANGNVMYDMPALKNRIGSHGGGGTALIVGDGISAADAVNYCLENNVAVVHVVKRETKEMKTLMLSRLAGSVYPEYSRVYKLMTGREKNDIYRCLSSTRVKTINSERGTASLETSAGGVIEVPFSFIVVCIGRESHLPPQFDQSGGARTVDYEFQSNYRSALDPSLFAVGSLAGDHFVRFLIGGCMQVAQSIITDYEARKAVVVRTVATPHSVTACRHSEATEANYCSLSPLYLLVKSACWRYGCRDRSCKRDARDDGERPDAKRRIMNSISRFLCSDYHKCW